MSFIFADLKSETDAPVAPTRLHTQEIPQVSLIIFLKN